METGDRARTHTRTHTHEHPAQFRDLISMQPLHFQATKQRRSAQDHYQNYYRGDAGNLGAQEAFRMRRNGRVSDLCFFFCFFFFLLVRAPVMAGGFPLISGRRWFFWQLMNRGGADREARRVGSGGGCGRWSYFNLGLIHCR